VFTCSQHTLEICEQTIPMKNGVFWDVTPCGSCITDVSEERSASFIRVTRIGVLGTTLAVTSNRRTLRRNNKWSHLVFFRSVRRLLVTTSVVPSSPIHVTLKKEALSSSETSVLTRAIRHNIPEDTILHSQRLENLKSYKQLLPRGSVFPPYCDTLRHSII
jgi:hypothetical protein